MKRRDVLTVEKEFKYIYSYSFYFIILSLFLNYRTEYCRLAVWSLMTYYILWARLTMPGMLACWGSFRGGRWWCGIGSLLAAGGNRSSSGEHTASVLYNGCLYGIVAAAHRSQLAYEIVQAAEMEQQGFCCLNNYFLYMLASSNF
jgi:hypothetical protein